MNLTPYHAKYIAYELTKRSPSNSLQKLATTLVDAQVDLNPHQVEAALFAFNSPLSKGAILADEVGLGKTIEAGLVISQKWAERKRKILIIAPANLRKQWSQELMDKFFMPSTIMEAKSFNDTVRSGNLNPFDLSTIVICSYQFVKTKEAYVKNIDWDLVVIDEAHRLRNVYKSSNKIAKAIKDAVEHAPKILLTATPLQNSLLELYGLVSIIDDYTFGDLRSFRSQFGRINSSSDETAFLELKERIKLVCKRTLRRQVLQYIKYTNRIALVEEFHPIPEEQQLYDEVSEYLQQEELYALPSSQRKLMTLILRRLLASSSYAISGTLGALISKLEHIISKNTIENIEEVLADNFEAYEELKDEWDEEESEESSGYTKQDFENIKAEIERLKEFEALAKSIANNSKGEKLFQALEKGFGELQRLGALKKAIIFTESTRTQEYLYSILEARGYTGKVVLFNGNNNDPKSKDIYSNWIERHKDTDKITGSKSADMRAALVDYFREEAVIMIATEAAAEGINLQFCSLLVNYDMPWNPQRIEQRIGRCHRYGQKFDVVVVNFLNKANAADQRVYELLKDKFKLFDGVFGASDEVLGSIENGIDFEKRIARIYQDCRTPEQIQHAFDELQTDLEGQITDAMQQTRRQLLENFDEEVHEKLRINLEESKEYKNKYEKWLWSLSKYYLKTYAEFTDDEHTFTLIANPLPSSVIHPGPYRIGKSIDESNNFRVSHPLAQHIIESCKRSTLHPTTLEFNYSGKIITILAPLKGTSGWLLAKNITISTFETEDHIVLAGFSENGMDLDHEQCCRLFSLEASETPLQKELSEEVQYKLEGIATKHQNKILEEIGVRNGIYFEQELDKLDKWGEDKRNSLKVILKDLDVQIKELKKLARSAPNLPDKLKIEKERKKLDSERDAAWREYDIAAKDIEASKDVLIDGIEKKMDQHLKDENLFLTHWKVM